MTNKSPENGNDTLNSPTFPIVGVVASAGGLNAFKQLLAAVPADCNMAFVLIPHLDPTHDSQMATLLAKVSLLPVSEVTQGMTAEARHVYVIPSKDFLTIQNGRFILSVPPKPQSSEIAIDFFLRSLAKDQGERSIGIVLSGTGSHGTLGIRDIKIAGGMAIAQEPSTAEFDSMPSSIIGEGLADYVLPPAEMPAMLVRYMQQPYVNSTQEEKLVSFGDDPQFIKILDHLRTQSHFDFRTYRKNMIMRRIQRRMGLHHLDRLESYLALLESDAQESVSLYRDLLISVTAFFRDNELYTSLSTKLAADFGSRDISRLPLRVWVPGCATGEEAYSLAMVLMESLDKPLESSLRQPASPNQLQIFASDVDDAAIAIARSGCYPTSISNDVSDERLNRFFDKLDDTRYRVQKQLRDQIVFSRQNVISDAPFSKLDLISCRNVLIYLEPEVQQRVLSLFHFSLCDDGLLILGPAESLGQAANLFRPISKKWRIFQKIPSQRSRQVAFPVAHANSATGGPQMSAPAISSRHGYKSLVDSTLISLYAPATALVNRRYEVLYFTGPLVNYLEFPTGEPSHNFLSMCRPGLRSKLRLACQDVMGDANSRSFEAQVQRDDASFKCIVDVRSVKSRTDSDALLLVSFRDEVSHSLKLPSRDAAATAEEPTASYVTQLEQELRSNTEELRGVIEELEDANEDLKSSNEEIMSMNEELQSANEELETSKEELQSLNEELSTLNLELLEKVTELDIANNDILNLIASTEIATLFLNIDLTIQRFTPPLVELMNLRATDIGRPLSDITMRFQDTGLQQDCRNVIRDAKQIQHEVVAENSRLYLLSVLPYRSQGNEVAGVVITFVDLTERLTLENSLKVSKDHLQAILDSAVDAIITVDHAGVISSLNLATERLFNYPRDDLLGRPISSLLITLDQMNTTDGSAEPQVNISEYCTGKHREITVIRRDSSRFNAELTVSRIDHSHLFIVVVRDVSQRKELQATILKIASDEQRRIGQELHDGTQQELTGLSLIAGTIEHYFSQRLASDHKEKGLPKLRHAEVAGMLATTTKLVAGLKAANQHVQSLSHGIMPVQIDVEGLQAALMDLADSINIEGKVSCQFVYVGSTAVESNVVATHLYRIAQEAVNNAQRHGNARHIQIRLTAGQQQIELEIKDDGIGVKQSSSSSKRQINQGMGMQIMEYRASVIGGELSISAGKEHGTVVRCTIAKQRNLECMV